MKKLTGDDKINSARLDLVTRFPFYGSIFFRLNVHESDLNGTAWTDGKSIGYNKKFMESLTHEQIVGVFVHECLHVILKHHIRIVNNPDIKKNLSKWQLAADFALNPIVKNTPGMSLVPGTLYDSRWDNSLAEDIFYQLPDSSSGCGEPDADDAGSPIPGEVWPTDQTTTTELDAEEQKVNSWIRSATFKAHGAGKHLSAMEKALIKTQTETSVSWTDELAFLCNEATKDDYTWKRPNVRYVQQGIYMPSLSGKTIVDVLIFVDSSGSVTKEQLSQIASEIQDIVANYRIRVVVVYWDTAFRGFEVFDSGDVLDCSFRLEVAGRGGTNFSGCWDWLNKNTDTLDINPKAILFFSDFECLRYPLDGPDVPVLWAHVPTGLIYRTNYLNYLPKYGKLVKVPPVVVKGKNK